MNQEADSFLVIIFGSLKINLGSILSIFIGFYSLCVFSASFSHSFPPLNAHHRISWDNPHPHPQPTYILNFTEHRSALPRPVLCRRPEL